MDGVFKTVHTKELVTGKISLANQVIHQAAAKGNVGAGGSWTIANDTATVKLPASQSTKTFSCPIDMHEGDLIQSFVVSGQIESAGNNVTFDADLRVTTAAASGLSDASIGAITQIIKAADYKMVEEKTGLNYTVKTGDFVYILYTATTTASTDIDLQGVQITHLGA